MATSVSSQTPTRVRYLVIVFAVALAVVTYIDRGAFPEPVQALVQLEVAMKDEKVDRLDVFPIRKTHGFLNFFPLSLFDSGSRAFLRLFLVGLLLVLFMALRPQGLLGSRRQLLLDK